MITSLGFPTNESLGNVVGVNASWRRSLHWLRSEELARAS